MLRTFENQNYASRKTGVNSDPIWRKLLSYSLLALCITLGAWCWTEVHKMNIAPIKSVTVEGTYNHMDKGLLQQIITPYTKKDFFNVDIATLRNHLLMLPWIAKVSITKKWPGTLSIHITEQQPVARWGENALINNQGIVFTPSKDTIPANLPLLNGPQTQQAAILNGYQQMTAILAPLGISITELSVSPRQAVYLRLNDGIQLILGRDNVIERLHRFANVFPHAFSGKDKAIDYVDMRYTNGMAVAWKNEIQRIVN